MPSHPRVTRFEADAVVLPATDVTEPTVGGITEPMLSSLRMQMPRASILALFPLAACGDGMSAPSSCQLGSLGRGGNPDTGALILNYSVECNTATYRVMCEDLEQTPMRWRITCAFGTFDQLITTAGGEVSSTFESEDCPQSRDDFNEACGYQTLPRDPNWGR